MEGDAGLVWLGLAEMGRRRVVVLWFARIVAEKGLEVGTLKEDCLYHCIARSFSFGVLAF